MSLKQEIEVWVQAMEAYDKQDYTEALQIFSNIADTSRILFNCGVIHATLGEHDRAVDCYRRAVQLDQYLAVAYFQEGVSNFLSGEFEEALVNFNDTLLYLRGNTFIDYEQLGLKFKLYSCEVLFNRGLCYMYLEQVDSGMQDFQYALKEKMTPDHEVIDEAIREKADGYTVFSIPVGTIYKPNEAKVKNLKQKDYLGRARLVATANANNVSTGFQGADRRAEAQRQNVAKDDRPMENISYAATNLVNRNMVSRRDRDQSAPPAIGRSAFPPTPPPETETKVPLTARSMSMRNNAPRSLQLNGLSNGRTSMDRSNTNGPAPRRVDTFASEPGPKRTDTFASSTGLGLDRQGTFDFDLSGTPRMGRGTPRMNGTPRLNTSLGPSPNNSQGPWSAIDERPRMGTMRSSSETRSTSASRRPFDRSPQPNSAAPKTQLPDHRRPSNASADDGEAFDDVYSMYGTGRGSEKRTSNRAPRQPQYIEEEDEDEDIIIESDSADEIPSKARPSQTHSRARSSITRREAKHEMRKIRVKVHASDDIRYIMINGSTIDYDDFESKVRAKFGLRGRLRMKTKDEDCGDMITMGDQDDLDTIVASASDLAKREKSEMGKVEVWVQEVY